MQQNITFVIQSQEKNKKILDFFVFLVFSMFFTEKEAF